MSGVRKSLTGVLTLSVSPTSKVLSDDARRREYDRQLSPMRCSQPVFAAANGC